MASFRLPSCALGARLFPPSKWAGLFPSAAYRRSAPPQLAAGIRTPCRVSYFLPVDRFTRQANEGLHFPAVGVGHTYPLQIENFLLLGRFWKITGQRVWRSEPRGPLPSGGLLLPTGREPHQTGEPWHLSCHGGNFTAKPHVPRAPCAPKARSPGSRGSAPWERSSWKNEYAKCC